MRLATELQRYVQLEEVDRRTGKVEQHLLTGTAAEIEARISEILKSMLEWETYISSLTVRPIHPALVQDIARQ